MVILEARGSFGQGLMLRSSRGKLRELVVAGDEYGTQEH